MLHLRGNSFFRSAVVCAGGVLGVALVATAQDQASRNPMPIAAVNPSSATASQEAKSGDHKTGEAASGVGLRLGNGDLVEVGVYNVPELSSRVRIDSNGNLYLPLIDYVHVAGLTLDEAQRVVEKRLDDGGFVKNPHVTIFVSEYASQGVSVLGEVTKPGVYPVLGDQQLLDLISSAGGLTDRAGHVVTITHRNEQDKPVTVELSKNLTDTAQSNVDIRPGDTIIVHKADVVYVVGAVNRPSGLLIDRGNLTVLQAIALAGGTTGTSKLNGARIIHKGPDGMTETRVPLKKILQARAPDITMKPDDILFVPSSVFKSAVHDNAAIAIQASSLGLVAVR